MRRGAPRALSHPRHPIGHAASTFWHARLRWEGLRCEFEGFLACSVHGSVFERSLVKSRGLSSVVSLHVSLHLVLSRYVARAFTLRRKFSSAGPERAGPSGDLFRLRSSPLRIFRPHRVRDESQSTERSVRHQVSARGRLDLQISLSETHCGLRAHGSRHTAQPSRTNETRKTRIIDIVH